MFRKPYTFVLEKRDNVSCTSHQVKKINKKVHETLYIFSNKNAYGFINIYIYVHK